LGREDATSCETSHRGRRQDPARVPHHRHGQLAGFRGAFCAWNEWYLPVSGLRLRGISRLIVEGLRTSSAAMPRMLHPAACRSAMVIRSSSERNRSKTCCIQELPCLAASSAGNIRRSHTDRETGDARPIGAKPSLTIAASADRTADRPLGV
jgi:hypothetical protein